MAEKSYMKPKIFIASSGKTYEAAEYFSKQLHLPGYDITPWRKLGVFNLSETTINSLENVGKQCDFGVFVLGQDDLLLTDRGVENTTRDNVIFELGLFAGRLGIRRSFMLLPTKVEIRIPSDLDGLTYAKYEASENGSYDFSDAIKKIKDAIKRSPASPIEKAYADMLIPSLVLHHCKIKFDRFVNKTIWIKLPAFACDAQVTICNKSGVILRHPKVSSHGHKIQTHNGVIIWSSSEKVVDGRPFDTVLGDPLNSWVVFLDKGFSQLYTPITGRSNNRLCAVNAREKGGKVYFLEIHQELGDAIDENDYRIVANIMKRRIEYLHAQQG